MRAEVDTTSARQGDRLHDVGAFVFEKSGAEVLELAGNDVADGHDVEMLHAFDLLHALHILEEAVLPRQFV